MLATRCNQPESTSSTRLVCGTSLGRTRLERKGNMRASILVCAPLLFAASCAVSEESELPEEVVVEETAPAPEPVFANNNCSNVDITVANWRMRDGVGTPIRVHRVEYYALGSWHSEDLSNQDIIYSWEGTWSNQDLAGADGDLITKWRVYYNVSTSGTWGPLVYQEMDTPNETCVDDMDVELTVL
jgi:hypothetical protein